jgi:Delta6-protoilludene synthase
MPQFYLPDPLTQWPWLRKLNPHYTEVKSESEAWLRGFESLNAKSQSSFDRCNFGKHPSLCTSSTDRDIEYTSALLGGLAYPLIDRG